MPRYFFDLVDDKTVFDQEGVLLPGLAQAKEFAVTFARELTKTKSEFLGESALAWSVQVSDGKFERLFSIPLARFTEPGAQH